MGWEVWDVLAVCDGRGRCQSFSALSRREIEIIELEELGLWIPG